MFNIKTIFLAFIISINSGIYLQGCDFQGGLVRYADFDASLNRHCVRKALENVDGLSDINYSQPFRNVHRFDYVVEGINNNLQYKTVGSSRVRYWNGYFYLNTVPKKEDVDKIHPYLIKIDRSIERECNIDILKHIDKDCSRMECN